MAETREKLGQCDCWDPDCAGRRRWN